MAFDVIGGEILERTARLVRPGGTLVSIAAPPTVWPDHGNAPSSSSSNPIAIDSPTWLSGSVTDG